MNILEEKKELINEYLLKSNNPEFFYIQERQKEHLHNKFYETKFFIFEKTLFEKIYNEIQYEYNYFIPKFNNIKTLKQYYDENSLEPSDLIEFKNQINPQFIKEFLNLEINNNEYFNNFKFNKISELINLNLFFDYNYNIPKPFHYSKLGFLKLFNFKINNFNIKINLNFKGFLQLYDLKKKLFISEQIYFKIENNNEIQIIKSFDNEFYINLEYIHEEIYLYCFIFLEDESKKNFYQPFCHNYINLFNNKNQLKNIKKFSNEWFNIENNLSEDNLFENFNNNNNNNNQNFTSYNIEFLFEIENIFELKYKIYYSWSNKRNDQLLLINYPNLLFNNNPIIILNNLQLFFKKNPNFNYIIIKANFYDNIILKKEDLNKNKKQFIISKDSTVLCRDFIYISNFNSKEYKFLEFLKILICDKLTENSHIIFEIIGYNDNEKEINFNNIIGYGVLPLLNDKEPIFENELIFNIFEGNELPKDYLKKSKTFNKTYFKIKIQFPHSIYPNNNFLNLYNNQNNIFILPPLYKNISKLELKSQLLNISIKLFSILDFNNGLKLLEFYRYFEISEIHYIINQWIYNNFNIKDFYFDKNKKFIEIICQTFKKIINEHYNNNNNNNNENHRQFLQDIINIYPILLNLININIINLKNNINININEIIEFIEFIPKILIEYILEFSLNNNKINRESLKLNYQEHFFNLPNKITKEFEETLPIILTKSLSQLIINLISFIKFEILFKFIHKYLYNFLQLKYKFDNKLFIYYIQFLFLEPFSFNKEFIIKLCLINSNNLCKSNLSPYNSILSIIFLSLNQIFEIEEEKLLILCCKFFSRIILCIEDLNNLLFEYIFTSLFPLLHILSTNFDSILLRNLPELQYLLIPIIIFLLSKSKIEILEEYFINLGNSFQNQFLNFLIQINNLIINKLDLNIPTFEKPNLNQELFEQLSLIILRFLQRIIKYLSFNIETTILLISILINRYQNHLNLKYFYIFIRDFIKLNSCQRLLISWLLDLFRSNRHSIRCFVTSLLLHIFESDFNHNNNLILSSIDIMDSLTAVLLLSDTNNIEIYQLLLERIIELSNYFNNSKLNLLLIERMEASKVITKCVEDQKKKEYPPEEACRILMRIADQYQLYPTMRLKWLLRIVETNEKHEDFISAFIGQFHIIVLICTVIDSINLMNENIKINKINNNNNNNNNELNHLNIVQPFKRFEELINEKILFSKNDFLIYPLLLNETNFSISNISKESLSLLNDFNIELLLKSIEKCIELGIKSNLYYSLRYIYSILIRIQYLTRNFKNLSNIFNNLSQIFNKILINESQTYENQLKFFLVEWYYFNENKEIIERQIYCSKNQTIENFINYLKNINRFKGSPIYENNNKNKNKEGVFISKLEEIKKNSLPEYEHCWNKFKESINILNLFKNINEIENIEYFEYEIEEYLPYYCMSSKIIKIEKKNIEINKFILNYFKEQFLILEQNYNEFEIFFPIKFNNINIKEEQLFLYDLKRIQKLIQNLLKGPKSMVEYLQIYSNKKYNESIEKAELLSRYIYKLLCLYLRAINELNNNSLNNNGIYNQNYTILIEFYKEFCNLFKLKFLDIIPFEGNYNDPMDEKFDFE